MRILPIITAIAVSFLSVGCSTPTPPPGVTVVSPFDVQRYPVSYTHLTLPTTYSVEISVVAGSLKKKKPKNTHRTTTLTDKKK